jgi:hypothetical protein
MDDYRNTVVSPSGSQNYQRSQPENPSFDKNLDPDDTNLSVESYYRDYPVEKVRAAQQYLNLYHERMVFEFIPTDQQCLYSYSDYTDVNTTLPISIRGDSLLAEPYQDRISSTSPDYLPTILAEEINEIEHLVEAMSLHQRSTSSVGPPSLSPSLYYIPSDYSDISPTPLSPSPRHITAPAFVTSEP